MNAHALLTSQGWRGSGHSLHPTDDSTGLARPLLVSQKQNVLGIGKKQHRTSDMWWMNAFDKSLQGLDTSKEGKVVQTVTNGGLDMVAKGGSRFVGSGGLYACFVRGESLTGTIKAPEEEIEEFAVMKRKSKRAEVETKEERKARKSAKRARRDAKKLAPIAAPSIAVGEIPGGHTEVGETKEQRKERRREKKLLREASEKKQTAVIADERTHKKKPRQD